MLLLLAVVICGQEILLFVATKSNCRELYRNCTTAESEMSFAIGIIPLSYYGSRWAVSHSWLPL